MKPHLTEEELFDLVEQDAPPANAHLQECATCRDEVANMRAMLGTFHAAVTSMAASHTPRLPVQRSRPAVLALTFAAPLLALAGLTAFAIALGSGHLASAHPHQTAAAEKLSTQEAAQQNLSDEALLNGIDQDLRTPLPPSLAPLARVTDSGEHTPSNQR